jgi:hypothetical protein
VVEIGPRAEKLVEPLFTRRLMQLELNDVDVPLEQGLGQKAKRLSLFYRVLAIEPHSIRIELWERGVFYGARSVDVSRGGSQLHSRRIALAAGELARDLRQARLARALEPKKTSGDTAPRPASEPVRLEVVSGAQGAWIGGGKLGLLGPEIGGQLGFDSGPELELRASWLFGGLVNAPGPVYAVWRELALSPGYMRRVSRTVGIGGGATFAAAALHLTRVASVDDHASSSDAWSARATLNAKLRVDLSELLTLSVRPEFGATLRHVEVVDRRAEERRLGGVWVGLGVDVAFGARTRAPKPH